MRLERTKNASRNIITGVLLKIYQLLIPFIMRTVMIYYMGVEYLGLNSLFTSILQVLNLAELGVGSAMVYSMYKPIVVDDKKKICALMHMYKIYYRVIGWIVLIIGLIFTPFLSRLITGNIPRDINIYILYVLNLLGTVLTYWLFAYKNSLFQAHQRVDVINKITLSTDTIKYVLQIVAIILIKNYYWFVIAILFTQIINNLTVAYFARKTYPEYKAIGELPKQEVRKINQRIKDLFTSKVGSVIINSADTIVISAFLGLTVLAIYQNYFYLFTAIAQLIAIVFTSVTAGVGNSIIVDSQKKVFKDFKTFLLIIVWIAGFSGACFLNLYQPFIEWWVGKDLLLEYNIVICLAVYFFVYEINSLLNFYKDASGMWHKDRFRPLVTALSNLGLNLILVQFIGLYGIVLSTVITMLLIGMPWLIANLFDVVFEKKYFKSFLIRMIFYIIVTVAMWLLSIFVCRFVRLPLILTVIVRLMICTLISFAIYFIVFRQLPEFKSMMQLANRITKGRISLLSRLAN